MLLSRQWWRLCLYVLEYDEYYDINDVIDDHQRSNINVYNYSSNVYIYNCCTNIDVYNCSSNVDLNYYDTNNDIYYYDANIDIYYYDANNYNNNYPYEYNNNTSTYNNNYTYNNNDNCYFSVSYNPNNILFTITNIAYPRYKFNCYGIYSIYQK